MVNRSLAIDRGDSGCDKRRSWRRLEVGTGRIASGSRLSGKLDFDRRSKLLPETPNPDHGELHQPNRENPRGERHKSLGQRLKEWAGIGVYGDPAQAAPVLRAARVATALEDAAAKGVTLKMPVVDDIFQEPIKRGRTDAPHRHT